MSVYTSSETLQTFRCAGCKKKDAEIARQRALLYGARCIYCGYTVSPDTKNQDVGDQVLRDHIAQCKAHPLTQAKAEISRLTAALENWEKDFILYRKMLGDKTSQILALQSATRKVVEALEHTAGYKYSVDPYLESIFKEQADALTDPVIVGIRREEG